MARTVRTVSIKLIQLCQVSSRSQLSIKSCYIRQEKKISHSLISTGMTPVVFPKRTFHLISESKYIVAHGTTGHRMEAGVNNPKTIIMVSLIARGRKRKQRRIEHTGCGDYQSHSLYTGGHFSNLCMCKQEKHWEVSKTPALFLVITM